MAPYERRESRSCKCKWILICFIKSVFKRSPRVILYISVLASCHLISIYSSSYFSSSRFQSTTEDDLLLMIGDGVVTTDVMTRGDGEMIGDGVVWTSTQVRICSCLWLRRGQAHINGDVMAFETRENVVRSGRLITNRGLVCDSIHG